MAATTADGSQATVRRFMNALSVGKLDEARSLLLDDFVVYEAGGLPYSGEYNGPDGFIELFTKMTEAMVLAPGPTIEYLLADDTVATRYRLTFTARVSAKSVEMSLVEVYTVRDGRIAALDVYYKDPSAVTALLTQ
jgi:ketosteroid isomerase-like protein